MEINVAVNDSFAHILVVILTNKAERTLPVSDSFGSQAIWVRACFRRNTGVTNGLVNTTGEKSLEGHGVNARFTHATVADNARYQFICVDSAHVALVKCGRVCAFYPVMAI